MEQDASLGGGDGAVGPVALALDAGVARDGAGDAGVVADFTPVVQGCSAKVAHVGSDVVVVASAMRDGKVITTVGTWNDATSALEHIATAGPIELEDTGFDVSVSGAGAAHATITIDYHCAPDLESKGGQIACMRAELARHDDTLRIVHKARNVHTGSYVERNYAPPGAAVDPLARAWLGKHAGCQLRTYARHVPIDRGTLDYDYGCPTPGPKAGATCTEECLVVWHGPDGRTESAPFDGQAQLLPLPGKGVLAYGMATTTLAPHALFIDGAGAHPVALPKGGSSSSAPFVAGESIFLEADDVVYEAKGAPSLTFTPACPEGAASCRFFDDPGDVHDGHGPRFFFAMKDGTPVRLLRRSGSAWSSFALPPNPLTPRLSHADALWLESEAAADGGSTLWHLGKTAARYRCTKSGPHALVTVP